MGSIIEKIELIPGKEKVLTLYRKANVVTETFFFQFFPVDN